MATKLLKTVQAASSPLNCPFPILGPILSPKDINLFSSMELGAPGQAAIGSYSVRFRLLESSNKDIFGPSCRERGDRFWAQRELPLICCTVNDNNVKNENMVWGIVPRSPTFWYLKEL